MMKNIHLVIPIIIAILVGMSMATQTGINNQLKNYIHSSIHSAFISFLIGTLLLGMISLFSSAEWPKISHFSTMPVFLWMGGLLGVLCVTGSIFLASRLGALSSTVAIVAGQLIISMIFEHFGWLGYQKIGITTERILGILLLMGGVFLVLKK